MPRQPHTSPHTRAVLSALLAAYPAQTYGYDLSKATDLKSGTLYPILQRLHEQGYLEAEWEPSPHAGKPPRHVYRLTEKGLRLARERREEEKQTCFRAFDKKMAQLFGERSECKTTSRAENGAGGGAVPTHA